MMPVCLLDVIDLANIVLKLFGYKKGFGRFWDAKDLFAFGTKLLRQSQLEIRLPCILADLFEKSVNRSRLVSLEEHQLRSKGIELLYKGVRGVLRFSAGASRSRMQVSQRA